MGTMSLFTCPRLDLAVPLPTVFWGWLVGALSLWWLLKWVRDMFHWSHLWWNVENTNHRIGHPVAPGSGLPHPRQYKLYTISIVDATSDLLRSVPRNETFDIHSLYYIVSGSSILLGSYCENVMAHRNAIWSAS